MTWQRWLGFYPNFAFDYELPYAIPKLASSQAAPSRCVRALKEQQELAESADVGLNTIKRLESGDGCTQLQAFARLMAVFGEIEKLYSLLDFARDDIGKISRMLARYCHPRAENLAKRGRQQC